MLSIRPLIAGLCWVGLFCLHQAACGQNATATRPNIVFLLTDDQTAGAVGCYGNPDVITPQLDRLAQQGTRFVNHYNTTSICMASRCSILTGLYEYRHGCNFDHGDLERRFFENSYPLQLRRAGYYTGFAGKLGFDLQSEDFSVIASEFDAWAGGPGQTHYETAKNPAIVQYAEAYPHCSRAYAAWAGDFLKAAKDSGRPFCLSISFKAPHLPFTPDPTDLELYAGKSQFARPENYGPAQGGHLSRQVQTSRAATDYREWMNDYDETARRYYALISGVDAAVGMIRDSLQREGLADNTVIIYTSDNGYNCGAHGFGDKVIPYEEGSKAPLIIFDPRLDKAHAGNVSYSLTANVDMAATILDLAGVHPAQPMDGWALRPLLSDPTAAVREVLPLFNFWGVPSAQSMALVTPTWKYIHWFYAPEGWQATEELFQLAVDRLEMKNLAHDANYQAELDTMRKHYDLELTKLREGHVADHAYEAYPTLFDRQPSWEVKQPLFRTIKLKSR